MEPKWQSSGDDAAGEVLLVRVGYNIQTLGYFKSFVFDALRRGTTSDCEEKVLSLERAVANDTDARSTVLDLNVYFAEKHASQPMSGRALRGDVEKATNSQTFETKTSNI